MTAPGTGGVTYAAAGVDIAAGERAVELMKSRVAAASRPEVVGGLGGFAGLFAVDFTRYRKPLLATSTDGVGTKIAIARALDKHDTIGIDLVGMVVDDLVVCGAEPLFMTDYIACGQLIPERIADIVGGVAEGCRQAGCALLGGETAEHPGVMAPDEYDLAGAGTGIVDADAVLSAERVAPGDVLIAMASSGLHSNGFSLVRHVVRQSGTSLTAAFDELGAVTLGEQLLTPTRIYARDCLQLIEDAEVRVFSHITGGGLASNVSRVLPPSADAVLERSSWVVPPLFSLVGALGGVASDELERTLNQGIGMVAVVSPDTADAGIASLTARNVPAWICGEVVAGSGQARLTGEHPAA